jgi:DNA-binding PadR family transcriptional regulator
MPSNAPLSNADTALLGLLCEGPMHPWQIQEVVEYRDMRFWTHLSQSTIYKQLRSLQRDGRVRCRPMVCDGRLRKVYSVTRKGREALLARLREWLAEPEHVKWRVDLATYNLHLLPRRQVLASLKTYRRKLQEGIACYRELDAFLESCGCPVHHRAVARRPVHLLEAEIRWLDEFVAELKRR